MKYFDAHSHYTHGKFSKDRQSTLDKLQKKDVAYVVDCFGTSKENILNMGLSLAKKYSFFYVCINDFGHYGEVDMRDPAVFKQLTHESIERMKKLRAENKKIVAYGECYMDFRKYEKTPDSLAEQTAYLKADFAIAKGAGLPVCIHSGNADQEAFDIIKDIEMPDYGGGKGMMHSYLGPPQMALDYIEMGYLISVTGVVTHRSPRGRNLVEVVKKVPLKHMIIETDCPYLTPDPYRDKRNDSSLLKYVVEAIAELKNVSPEKVAAITTENAKALYGIK